MCGDSFTPNTDLSIASKWILEVCFSLFLLLFIRHNLAEIDLYKT